MKPGYGLIIAIKLPSAQSLLLRLEGYGNDLGPATGFVARFRDQHFLVTKWHVLAGRRPDTGQPIHEKTGAVPDTVVIAHHVAGQPGRWRDVREPLYDDDNGAPRWLEHPGLGRKVDVVALPLTDTAETDLYAYDLENLGSPVLWGVSSPLSIIGFPLGRSVGGLSGTGTGTATITPGFAVWLKGWVASEPDIDYEDLPLFLIDARTREGQSGSPVIFYDDGGGFVSFADGSVQGGTGKEVTRLVGVYSGRISEDSDIGRVWKLKAVLEVASGVRPSRV